MFSIPSLINVFLLLMLIFFMFSILGVFTVTGFIDWHMVERGYSAEEFLYAVEYHVLPHLNTYPAPNSILVRNALVFS